MDYLIVLKFCRWLKLWNAEFYLFRWICMIDQFSLLIFISVSGLVFLPHRLFSLVVVACSSVVACLHSCVLCAGTYSCGVQFSSWRAPWALERMTHTGTRAWVIPVAWDCPIRIAGSMSQTSMIQDRPSSLALGRCILYHWDIRVLQSCFKKN